MGISDQDDERLSAYLDGELDDAEVAELESRLAQSASLAAQLDAVHDAIVALRGLDQVVEPHGLADRVRERIAQEQDAQERVAQVVPLPRRPWLVTVSAAAAIIIALTGAVLLPQLGNNSIIGSHLAEQAARAPQLHIDEAPGSLIADSEAVLTSEAAARTYLSSSASSAFWAQDARGAIVVAPPFRSGVSPGACLDAVAPADGSSVVARVESVVYEGQPALAYVVRRGGSDQTDALVVDPATCTAKLSVTLGSSRG
jgi:negative regulator of sigma E activity